MTRALRGWTVTGLLAGLVLVGPGPAHASCAEDSGPRGSEVVFVGVPEEERRGYTRLVVIEVWDGPDLAPEVWVRTGQEQPPFPLNLLAGTSSSVDADLAEGSPYAVGADGDFVTSVCRIRELSRPVSSAPGRPDRAREPSPAGLSGADPPAGPWQIGIVSALLVFATARLVHVARSRRREPLAD